MVRHLGAARQALAVLLGLAALAYLVAVYRSPVKEPSVETQGTQPSPVAAGAATAPTSAEASEEREAIRIGWTAWADAEIVTTIAKRLLEDRFGLDTALIMADIGLQYQGVASGDLDIMMMSWQPVTHRNYWRRVSDVVVNLGPVYNRARLGWAVPAYVPKERIASLDDLRAPDVRRRLNGQIQGIDPGSGLMQASETAMQRYQLNAYRLVGASDAAMTAALDRAIRRREWIVVTAWSPHWMFARWDLRWLDDPDRVFGGRERVHILTRPGFNQDYPPEVTEFFTRMYIPMDDLETAMLTASQSSVDEAADTFIANHPGLVHYWVTGHVTTPGAKAAPGGSN